MRTPRKDMFVSIYALVWGVTDMVLYFVYGMDTTMVSNCVFIILLIAVLMCSPLMRWLNKK
jgi:energy-converting hydrogenase Eha subunit F